MASGWFGSEICGLPVENERKGEEEMYTYNLTQWPVSYTHLPSLHLTLVNMSFRIAIPMALHAMHMSSMATGKM